MNKKNYTGNSKAFVTTLFTLLVGLAVTAPQSNADRGGWADPPGGWSFVEEWQSIPLLTDDPKWDHDNGSDSYSGNAHTATFTQLGITIGPNQPVGDVVRIDTIAGQGETENGTNQATDAKVLTMIDLGDPRSIAVTPAIADPSDRKLYFMGPLHEPGDVNLPEDPFEQGVTMVVRFRVVPMVQSPIVNTAASPDPINFVALASNRAQVGIGFRDPAFPELVTLLGIGYFEQGTVSVIGDNSALYPIASGIDTNAFHTIWISAQTDPDDFAFINYKAYIDGSTTPVEDFFVRRGFSGNGGDPENLETAENPEWAGFPQLAINIGSAGTGTVGILQYDYIAATYAGAFDAQPGSGLGTGVSSWELY